MFSRFFIDRPVFSWVIAIIIMLAGILSISTLPVSQYPQIAPPQVSITATYPGASASTIENTVTQVIEQNLTGLDGYLYMQSTSDSAGRVSITVTFETGTNPDMAPVNKDPFDGDDQINVVFLGDSLYAGAGAGSE